jgi:hypothetical protein
VRSKNGPVSYLKGVTPEGECPVVLDWSTYLGDALILQEGEEVERIRSLIGKGPLVVFKKFRLPLQKRKKNHG